jgi:hypothetical protein
MNKLLDASSTERETEFFFHNVMYAYNISCIRSFFLGGGPRCQKKKNCGSEIAWVCDTINFYSSLDVTQCCLPFFQTTPHTHIHTYQQLFFCLSHSSSFIVHPLSFLRFISTRHIIKERYSWYGSYTFKVKEEGEEDGEEEVYDD